MPDTNVKLGASSGIGQERIDGVDHKTSGSGNLFTRRADHNEANRS